MKKILLTMLLCVVLTGCSDKDTTDSAITQFTKDMNTLCDNIVEIDKDINRIEFNANDEFALQDSREALIAQLVLLEEQFTNFGAMDFPADYDYLEAMADEASAYMTEAVKTYKEVYADEASFSATTEEYARENYARAYKRLRIITALLRGETPDEEGLTIQ